MLYDEFVIQPLFSKHILFRRWDMLHAKDLYYETYASGGFTQRYMLHNTCVTHMLCNMDLCVNLSFLQYSYTNEIDWLWGIATIN